MSWLFSAVICVQLLICRAHRSVWRRLVSWRCDDSSVEVNSTGRREFIENLLWTIVLSKVLVDGIHLLKRNQVAICIFELTICRYDPIPFQGSLVNLDLICIGLRVGLAAAKKWFDRCWSYATEVDRRRILRSYWCFWGTGVCSSHK